MYIYVYTAELSNESDLLNRPEPIQTKYKTISHLKIPIQGGVSEETKRRRKEGGEEFWGGGVGGGDGEHFQPF